MALCQIEDLQTRILAERMDAASEALGGINSGLSQMLSEAAQKIEDLAFQNQQLKRAAAGKEE